MAAGDDGLAVKTVAPKESKRAEGMSNVKPDLRRPSPTTCYLSPGLRLRPHHLLDIVAAHGAGRAFLDPHPYGHALASVAARVLADLEVVVEFICAADDICAPCRYLVNGTCTDDIKRFDPPVSKQVYNDALDRRLFSHLKLAELATMTVRKFLALVRHRLEGIEAIWEGNPGEVVQQKKSDLESGLLKLSNDP